MQVTDVRPLDGTVLDDQARRLELRWRRIGERLCERQIGGRRCRLRVARTVEPDAVERVGVLGAVGEALVGDGRVDIPRASLPVRRESPVAASVYGPESTDTKTSK